MTERLDLITDLGEGTPVELPRQNGVRDAETDQSNIPPMQGVEGARTDEAQAPLTSRVEGAQSGTKGKLKGLVDYEKLGGAYGKNVFTQPRPGEEWIAEGMASARPGTKE